MSDLDRSHDPALLSWVTSANGHPLFPIQNLPFGATDDGIVVAIGNYALSLSAAMEAGWGSELSLDRGEFAAPFLNLFLFKDPAVWRATRLALSDALSDPAWQERLSPALNPLSDVELRLPFAPGDYTDFYASINHARNVGALFRPDNPLLPNYQWVPIGYHGRTSTIVVDGTPIRRPKGQLRPPTSEAPEYAPSRSLDYELELGIVVGGLQQMGDVVPAAEAAARIFGVVLLNDWSARDIQSWEYQPLGPFLAKNFATTISPWVVTADALLPYRVPMPARGPDDPQPLEYLQVPNDFTWSIELTAAISTASMMSSGSAPAPLAAVQFSEAMYWSPAQLVTHHASNGCALEPGDLLGTGTISGPQATARGCLLELTKRGAEPVTLPDGTKRGFLEDGDRLTLSGRATFPGRPSLGFGSCAGTIEPAS